MLRKLTITLLSLLPLALSAQLATGSWKFYPAFGTPDRLIETPHHVYLATSGSLHSYDKANDESYAYLPGTDLGGTRVDDIYYNYDKGYLLVAYEDGNIDILMDNGERIPLPEIRDSNVSSKEINHVTFDDGLIYIATTFGIVIYDDTTFQVKESGIFNTEVLAIATTPENLLIVISPEQWTYTVYSSPKTERHNNLNKFKRQHNLGGVPADIVKIADDKENKVTHFALRTTRNQLHDLVFYDSRNSGTYTNHGTTDVTGVFHADDGVWFTTPTSLNHISFPWTVSKSSAVTDALQGNMIATISGPASIWAADVTGLANYRLSDDGSITVMRDRYRPSGSTTFSDICSFYPLPDNRGFLMSNRGLSRSYAVGKGDFYDKPFTGNAYEDGKISNIEASGITYKSKASAQTCVWKGDHIFSPTFLLEDPDNPSIHYVGSGNEGVYVLKDGRQIGKFDDNSLIKYNGNYAWRTTSAQFDPKGNLLVAVYTEDTSAPPLVILPSDKRKKDPATVTKEDWIGLDFGGNVKDRDVIFHLCNKIPVILLADSRYQEGFKALYYGNSITDTSDDQSQAVATMTDQDGKGFTPDYITCFAEDSRGRVWIGTTNGPAEIVNPANIFGNDFRINRLKIPRNDGTNLADYLLDTEKIHAIAVDASDRKWIATDESGLYLVSPNGDEIIENFNTSNSPLATNCVSDIYIDPNSNSVFIATLHGLYEYSSTSSPGRPDYSDVIAYPNPVTPGYTGLITIRGLMDSSMVKIMDSGMHLVYQTISDGGMATWDGCTLNGARVKSGVYYVLASTSSDTDSQGDVVAKILVVN